MNYVEVDQEDQVEVKEYLNAQKVLPVFEIVSRITKDEKRREVWTE